MVVRAANDQAHPQSSSSATGTVGVTLAEQAYLKIRKDIIHGHLSPNQPLRFEYLRETYDLSFSPLREALTRLQSERLVVASALKGYRVAEISIAEMWDTLRTRSLIEGQALSQAIQFGDDDWEGGIVAAFHALSRHSQRLPDQAAADDIDEMERRHRNFHLALLSACQSRWLMDLSSLLYLQSERYRWPTLQRKAAKPSRPETSPRDIEGEHQALMEATLARDSAKAVTLLAAHTEATGRYIEQIMSEPQAAAAP